MRINYNNFNGEIQVSNLATIELKTFLPSKDFALSKTFYQDLGFTLCSDESGIAYFHFEHCSFLLQDYYVKEYADNFMMHLLVEDVYAWHNKIVKSGVTDKYQVRLSDVSQQPWGMLDFVLHDPSGVLWRFGQNI